MANVFLNLPVPAGNGTGVAVDTSVLGPTKTITVQGTGFDPSQPFQAAITVEVSEDGGVNFVPLFTFTGPQKKTFDVVAGFMRVTVSSFVVGASLNVDVASNDNGALFASLPATAGTGVGASIDVSALGTFNSVQVTGVFSGSVIVEASEDGADFNPCFAFNQTGALESKDVVARFMRVRRENVSLQVPGLPVVSIGGANDPSPAGSAAPSASNCLIYREGDAASGPVVFGAWAPLIARLAFLRAAANGSGCYQILFDNSIKPAMTIPAGGPYNMENVEWKVVEDRGGAASFGFVAISVADGASFTKLREFSGPMFITNLNTVTSPIADGLATEQIVLRDGAFLETAAGTVPFVDLSGIGAGEVFTIDVENLSGFGSFGAGVPTVSLPTVGAFLAVSLATQSNVGADAISLPVGAFVLPSYFADSVFYGEPQSLVLGTTLFNQQSDLRWDDNRGVLTAAAPAGASSYNEFNAYDVSGGAVAQTLGPLPGAENTRGTMQAFKEVSGTVGLTIVPGVGDTIDLVAAAFAVPAGGCVIVEADGVSNWRVVSVFDPASATAIWTNDGTNLTPILNPRVLRNTSTGNARGAEALDWQATRAAVTQVASGDRSAIPGGESNTASGINSFAMGDENVASGDNSVALGEQSSAIEPGQKALSNGQFASVGDNKFTEALQRGITSAPATPVTLTFDGLAQVAGNSFVMPDRSAWLVEARIVCANESTDPISAAFVIRALFNRAVGAATTVLVGVQDFNQIANEGTMLAGLFADTVIGGPEIVVNQVGEAIPGDSFRWTAYVSIVELEAPT